jgi:uncharacterized membrane protein YidH (DUF202 family)
MAEPEDLPDQDGAPDTGLAAERTDIAWSRSALALVTCVAVVMRRVPSMSRAASVGLVVTVVLMLAGAGFLLRRRLAAHERDPAIVVARLRLRNLAILTSLTGALCMAVMLLTIG